MPHRSAIRIIRTPIFLAGEGKSEKGYGTWLARLAKDQGVAVAIKAEKLHGGDPLSLVEQAINKLNAIKKYRGRYSIRGLLLDEDRKGQDNERDAKAEQLARSKRIHLIWQVPTHEAFLLRHFPRCQELRPTENHLAERELKRVWPRYNKPMCADEYGDELSLDHLARARGVEPDLDAFLVAMGWH
ncbi:MAG: RloB domain-containing protein [Rhodospirillales bacterium]